MSRVHRSPTATGSHPRIGDPTDSDAIVRVLFEKSPLLVYIVDLDFKVVLINRILRESTGYDTSDCPNVDALLRRFYPDNEYRSVVEGIHQGFVRNEHIRDTELVATIKDGTQRTISWSTSRLRIGRGPSVGYIAFGVDVTTRRNLQQWVTLFQRSLAHLHEGVVMTEPSGRVLAWSDGAADLLGYKDDEMQGRPLTDLYLSAEREIIARTVDRAIEGEGRYAGEVELEHKSGSTRILAFEQHRLDGDQGVPLARLTVLAEPAGAQPEDSAELAGRIASFEAQLAERDAALTALREEQASQVAAAADADGQLAALKAELEAAAAKTHALDEAVREAQNAAVDAARKGEEAAARLAEVEARSAEHDTSSAQALAAVQGEVSEAAKARDEALARAEAAQKDAEASHEEADAARLAAEAAKLAAEMEADDLREQLEEAQEAATTATTAHEAELARANQADAALAKAQAKADARVAEAQAVVEEREQRIAELEATLTDAESRAAEAEVATAALAAATATTAELQAKITELEAGASTAGEETEAELAKTRARVSELESASEAAQERWIQERSKLEDEHRAAIDTTQDKAARERQDLEEQLSRDILAAEERSEEERTKLIKQHELERKGLEDAIQIARAEVKSEYSAQLDQLRAELARAGALQPHLVPLESSAVIAADTEGRVIGWSGGAAMLDRRPDADAVGKVIHKDVLELEGINWKTIFGKVVVAGQLEQDVTLIDAQGNRRDVLLKAALVKDAGGKLLGVTEVLVAPELQGGVELHARAAFGRLAEPVHGAIEARALAGLETHRQASAAASDLARLGRAVLEGGAWTDVTDAARRIGLRELLPVVDDVLRRADDSWRDLRATAQDLGHLAELMQSRAAGTVSWTELVSRCVHAVAGDGIADLKRELGDGGEVTARTDRLVALLVVLLETLRSHPGATVRTGFGGGHATLELAGVRADRDALAVARALARDLGGEIEADDAGLRLRLPTTPPRIESPGLMEERDGEATELISADVVAQLTGPSQDVSSIVEVLGSDEALEVEAGEAEEADEESTDAVGEEALELDEDEPAVEERDKGSVEFLEEGEYGNLLLAAGEDSVIAAVPGSPAADGGVPGIDALEEVFQDGADVSPALLAQAAEMDAYANARVKAPDRDAPKPSPDLLAEMTSTDTGERLGEAAAKAKPKPKKRRSRKTRKKN